MVSSKLACVLGASRLILTCVAQPFAVGFSEDPGELPFKNPAVVVDMFLQLTFLVDMCISFRLVRALWTCR